MISSKQPTSGRVIKLLAHTQLDRGMTLIPEVSRCVRRHEIHELVATNQRDLAPGSRVDRVAFLGFAEFTTPGVVERGDEMWIDGICLGTVVGFDACHHPNHYNIIVETGVLAAGADLGLGVGAEVKIAPGRPNVPTDVPPTIILGLGKAGGGLHLPCIRKVREILFGTEATSCICVIDPYIDFAGDLHYPLRGAIRVDDLASIPRADRERAVVHVCTPPRIRGEVLERASELGIRRFVIEKPMANSPAELERIVRLANERNLEIVVVSCWTSSAITDALRSAIGAMPHAKIARISVSQSKSRISLSQTNASHDSALDVELPHMLGLVRTLCGDPLTIVQASCWDIRFDGVSVCNMGGAAVRLETPLGLRIDLRADHMAPFRERKLCVWFADGARVECFYPCDSADFYSQLCMYDAQGDLIRKEFVEDDTVTRFLLEAYRYFEASGPRPRSDLAFNVDVCSLLNDIRRQCVLIEPPILSLSPSLVP